MSKLFKITGKDLFLLSVLLLFVLFTQTIDISSRGLQDHEIGAINFAETLGHTTYVESNGICYHSLILKPFIALFGDSALAVRLPSLIFSVGSLILVYLLAGIIGGREVAFFASLLFAFNGAVIYYAKYCRFYSVNMFFSLLSSFLFLKVCQTEKRKFWICYILSMFACLGTMMSSVFLFPAHWLYYLYISYTSPKTGKKSFSKPLFIVFCLAAACFCQVLVLTINDPSASMRIADYAEVSWHYFQNVSAVFFDLNREVLTKADTDYLWDCSFFWIVLPFLALKGAFSAINAIKQSNPKLFLILLNALVPLGIIALFSRYCFKIFTLETTLFILPYYSVLMGVGLASKNKFYKILCLVFLLLSAPGMIFPSYYFAGGSWKPKLEYINCWIRPKDKALIVNDVLAYPYYMGGNLSKFAILSGSNVSLIDKSALNQTLEKIAQDFSNDSVSGKDTEKNKIRNKTNIKTNIKTNNKTNNKIKNTNSKVKQANISDNVYVLWVRSSSLIEKDVKKAVEENFTVGKCWVWTWKGNFSDSVQMWLIKDK